MDSKVRPSAHSGLRGYRESVPVCITGSCSRHNRYSEDSITAQAGRKECPAAWVPALYWVQENADQAIKLVEVPWQSLQLTV